MDTYTTGQVARAARISEKAVRIYADRGMLEVSQEQPGSRRSFAPEAVVTARAIALLRDLDLSLEMISHVLASTNRVATFDLMWNREAMSRRDVLARGEYVRSVLAGSPALDVEVLTRCVDERLTLDWHGASTLPDMAETITSATRVLFEELHKGGVELAGPPFVEHHARATESAAARVSVRVPIVAMVRPTASSSLSIDPAHAESYVQLNEHQARDQAHLVAVHDYLSAGRFDQHPTPLGDNREIYLPSWGTGAAGPVMEIAVPEAGPKKGHTHPACPAQAS